MHQLFYLLQSTYINALIYGEQFEQFAIVIMEGWWDKFFSITIHLCLPTHYEPMGMNVLIKFELDTSSIFYNVFGYSIENIAFWDISI